MTYCGHLSQGWSRGGTGMLQKLDAFYCIFERFRQFWAYIMHFSLFLHLIPLQLIVLTALSPFKEVKQHRRRLYLDGCPFGSFTQFYSVFTQFLIFAEWQQIGSGEHGQNIRRVAAANIFVQKNSMFAHWRYSSNLPPMCEPEHIGGICAPEHYYYIVPPLGSPDAHNKSDFANNKNLRRCHCVVLGAQFKSVFAGSLLVTHGSQGVVQTPTKVKLWKK